MGPAIRVAMPSQLARAVRRYFGGRLTHTTGVVCAFAVALAAALLGCGATHRAPEQQQVKDVLRSYLRAQVAGDGQAACGLLTAGGQRQLIAVVVKAGKGVITTRPSCEDAVGLVRAVAGQRLLDSMRNARIENVQVRGARATALVVVGINTSQKVSLVKSAAAWKIAAVSGLGG